VLKNLGKRNLSLALASQRLNQRDAWVLASIFDVKPQIAESDLAPLGVTVKRLGVELFNIVT
jgi:hypothetical protein